MFRKYLSALTALALLLVGSPALVRAEEQLPEYEWQEEIAEPELTEPQADAEGAETALEDAPQEPVQAYLPETAPEGEDSPADMREEVSATEEDITAAAAATEATGIAISAPSLGVGQTGQITLSLEPAGASAVISYSSSKTKVAKISETGEITAASAGTATITAETESGLKATCKITVVKAPSKITLNASEGTLGVGGTAQISYTLTKGTMASVSFTSSDENVASVSADGLIRAKSAGTATITARTHNGKTATCKVTVKPAPTSIVVDALSRTIGTGQRETLACRVNDGAYGTVTYRSGDESICAVTEDGVLTGVNEGSTFIYVSTYVPGVTATLWVNVVKSPDRVTIPGSLQLGAQETCQLVPEIPSGTMAGFTYASSKSKVAKVSEDGVITAVASGTATITVTTTNGLQATCKVTVLKAPSKISLNASSGTLGVGETASLSYTLTKNTAATVTFTSSDESVATVSASGLVTGKRTGTATITARTHNGKTATCKVTVVPAPTSIITEQTSYTIGVGQAAALNCRVNDGSHGEVTYISGNSDICAVSADGRLTGVGPGTTWITATTYAWGVSAYLWVTVVPVPDSVSIESSLELGVQETYALQPVIPNGTMSEFTYTSSKAKVARVSEDGVITALAAGTATITVTTGNGKKASCKVTVLKAPDKITLNATKGTLGVGETYVLSYTLPKNTKANVTFSSSKPEVATVEAETGIIRAVSTGTAVITATAQNGKTARCEVTVKPAPTYVAISAASSSLGIGETMQLNVEIDDGAACRISYISDDPDIASVDGNGKVTAVGVGTTQILAASYLPGVSARIKVTVGNAPKSVSLPASVTIGLGDTYQMRPVLPEGAGGSMIFASNKTSVATVSSTGLVTAKAKGTATVGVKTFNGKMATMKVTVTDAPTSISLNMTDMTLSVGDVSQLTAQMATSGTIRYESSNTSVVTVDSEGSVTAVGGGTAFITATSYNGLEAVCEVEVLGAPSRLYFTGGTLQSMGVGQKLQLNVASDTGADTAVTWRSSKASVAEVDANGQVTALAVGQTVITAMTNVSGLQTSMRIVVYAAPDQVSLNMSTLAMASMEAYQLFPSVPGGTKTSFSYASSDSKVATVDANGVITAREAGTATISVTTHNGKTASLALTVTDPYRPLGVSISDMPEFIAIGSSVEMSYTMQPASAGREMTWSSTDPEIAVVDANGVISALSPGLATVVGVSTRNSQLKVEYGFIVLSETRSLMIPDAQTSVADIAANMERIQAIEGSAYAELYDLYSAGTIAEAEYIRRVSVIRNAFDMYAFPWMTPTNELYWSAANSENGKKNFKPGVVYYGLPYTSNSSNRIYNVDKLLDEGYYTVSESGEYYVWETSKFSDRDYPGTDCSGFAGMAYYGATSRGVGLSSAILAKDDDFKTISWSQSLRTGDLLVASAHHVAIFLYYVDEAKSQIMIIDQGGGVNGVNTVAASIKDVSYYTSRGYIIRRLKAFAN